MVPAHAARTYSTEANASHPASQKNRGSAEDNERERTKCLSGYIFLCNQTTKLQCYQYRVFGLPWAKKEVVEEIKSGSKLFLFDFKSKLLYGVYEATSDGNINLEPAAFGGKFPAQVKFKIFKECLPLPESSLRYVIKENYTGAKFKQELSGEQVTKLISSFRPLASSICQPTHQALAHVPPQPVAVPPSLSEYQHKPTGRLPVMEIPYLAEVQFSHIEPAAEARPVLNVNYLEHGSHRTAAYVEHVHPSLDRQSLPAASRYVSHPEQPFYQEHVARQVQEPSYSRYRTITSGSQHAPVTSSQRYTIVEQRASHDELAISGGQYYQLPLQREAQYQAYYPTSTATDGYTPSVLQTQSWASYHQLPSQGRQYQESTVAHSSNPAVPVQHTTSDYWQHRHEPYVPLQNEATLTAYNSSLIANSQYASSVFQTQVPVPYDQPSLRGPEYQDHAVANSSNPAAPTPYTTSVLQTQVQATYLPLQREVIYQDNVVSCYSNPTVPPQYTSQREATYQDNVVPYNSNPTAPVQYTSQREATYQDNVVPYNSNPTVPAQYTSQREAMYQDNVVPYNSNPTVPAQYTSVSQQQGSATNLPFQGEALH